MKEKRKSRSERKSDERRSVNLHPHALYIEAVAPDDRQYWMWRQCSRIWFYTVNKMLADLTWAYHMFAEPRLVDLAEQRRIKEEAAKAKGIRKADAAMYNELKQKAEDIGEAAPKRERDRHPVFNPDLGMRNMLTPEASMEIYYFAFAGSTSVGIRNPSKYYECRQRFFHYWRWYASQIPEDCKFPVELGAWMYDGVSTRIKAVLDGPGSPGSKCSRIYGMLQGEANNPRLVNFGIPFLTSGVKPHCRIHFPKSKEDENQNIEMSFDLNNDTTLKLVIRGLWNYKGDTRKKSLHDSETLWRLSAFARGYDKYKFQTPTVNMKKGRIKIHIPYTEPGEEWKDLDASRHLALTPEPDTVATVVDEKKGTESEQAVWAGLAVDYANKLPTGVERWKKKHLPCQLVLDKLNGYSAVAIRRAKAVAEARSHHDTKRKRRMKAMYARQNRTTEARSKFVLDTVRCWVQDVLHHARLWNCGTIKLAMPSNLAKEIEAAESATAIKCEEDSVDQGPVLPEEQESVEKAVERSLSKGRGSGGGRLHGYPWQWHEFKKHLKAKCAEHGLLLIEETADVEDVTGEKQADGTDGMTGAAD